MGRPKLNKEPVVEKEEKVNPTEFMIQADAEKVRAPGDWIKATYEEILGYERDGIILGYDSINGQVLLKK